MECPPNRVRPGLEILLPAAAGGYSDLGWDPNATAFVQPLPPDADVAEPGESAGSDPNSSIPVSLTVAAHTGHVCDELAAVVGAFGERIGAWAGPLTDAARWHDAGKGRDAFQHGVRKANPTLDPSGSPSASATGTNCRPWTSATGWSAPKPNSTCRRCSSAAAGVGPAGRWPCWPTWDRSSWRTWKRYCAPPTCGRARRRPAVPDLDLPGCTPQPLMGYLKALGVFRLVAEQKDRSAALSWAGGVARLHTTPDRDGLIDFMTRLASRN